MFKMGLLTSTAMTALTLLLSGAPTGAYAQTDMHVASRDPNTRFLCTYGQFLVSAFYSSLGSGYFRTFSERVAVPVRGRGQTVHEIRVIEAQGYRFAYPSSFQAAIYSNSPSGFPGKLIAYGTGRTSPSCGPVKISITPTKLKRNMKYWIEETTPIRLCRTSVRAGSGEKRRQSRPSVCSGSSSHASVYWQASPNSKRRAYAQYHTARFTSHSSSSYTSPWSKQPMGPYFKLK